MKLPKKQPKHQINTKAQLLQDNLLEALKVLVAAQLIAENADTLIDNNLVAFQAKCSLKKLNKESSLFIENFWRVLFKDKKGNSEALYQNLIAHIEIEIENIIGNLIGNKA